MEHISMHLNDSRSVFYACAPREKAEPALRSQNEQIDFIEHTQMFPTAPTTPMGAISSILAPGPSLFAPGPTLEGEAANSPIFQQYFEHLMRERNLALQRWIQNLVPPGGGANGVSSECTVSHGMSPTLTIQRQFQLQLNTDMNMNGDHNIEEKSPRKRRKDKENILMSQGDAVGDAAGEVAPPETPLPTAVKTEEDGKLNGTTEREKERGEERGDSREEEPQMSTPDDPVIHSPPSLGGQIMNGGYNPTSVTKMEEGLAGNSPDGSAAGDTAAEARRQKTCRVCGDHATGYNFNVITCESCKAFFRRNALRPKEFKCPYSEDCEINAVSRRFCQKCRLRKCFSVGMKKEWILNEEQLRRRKNSRLNNMATQQQKKQQDIVRQQAIKSMSSGPLSINPMEAQFQLGALNGRGTVVSSPLVSPPSQQGYPLISPTGSGASSDSPPSRPVAMTAAGQRSPDAVVLSMDEYHNLVQMAGQKHFEEEPPTKRSAYSPSDLAAPQPRAHAVGGLLQGNTAALRPNVSGMSSASYMDIGAAACDSPKPVQPQYPPGYAEKMEKMNLYFDKTIEDALKIDSIDSPQNSIGQGRTTAELMQLHNESMGARSDSRINYQLNSTELRALDMVTEAFKGMNDEVEQGRQKTSCLKSDKSPADILNIMDITMRRLVKMAKKLPAFNDLSQDGKFALLKGGMVEMVTVRGVAKFDPTRGAWRSSTFEKAAAEQGKEAEVSLNMFDSLNQSVGPEQKMRFMKIFEVFHADLRSNELAISLIILVVLFSPRDTITDPEDRRQIARNREHYLNLLNRYLESLYGDDAHRLFARLPQSLAMLKEISRNSGGLFMGTVNPAEAEPLPREIFKIE